VRQALRCGKGDRPCDLAPDLRATEYFVGSASETDRRRIGDVASCAARVHSATRNGRSPDTLKRVHPDRDALLHRSMPLASQPARDRISGSAILAET
jgi:hypothetical protein